MMPDSHASRHLMFSEWEILTRDRSGLTMR
jgi:hypothetical protein